MQNLKGRSLLTLLDYAPEEIDALLLLAADLKARKKAGVPHRWCEGKSVALIFEKNSTRTRCAFEVAAADLGIHPVFLDPKATHIGKKESIRDTARVLGRMFDGIEYRGYSQKTVEELAVFSGVPVWNGLTDAFHPTQALADLLTAREHFGGLRGLKLVYLGDAHNNMANSLMVACAKMGMHYTACAPATYFPENELRKKTEQIAAQTGAELRFMTEPELAVKGADILYTDVWISMGESEELWAQRIQELLPYRVDQRLLTLAGEQCRFMHCLPSFHNKDTELGRTLCERFSLDCLEVTDEVFEGSKSLVFDEAENRMHTIKAVIAAALR